VHPFNPPIFVKQRSGVTVALSSTGQVIDYVRSNNDNGESWNKLRAAAFGAERPAGDLSVGLPRCGVSPDG
jgi:hypothetical protein